MTTRLAGPATTLPALQPGRPRRGGQPAQPAGGHRTAYLWEQVWERESWLEILGRYLIAQRDKKKQIEQVIFPRYHQLDVTRKLQAAVLAEGPGRQVPDPALGRLGQDQLHRLDGALPRRAARRRATSKVFDTVLVVSDRNVIDAQLQEALFDFERTTGVVATHHRRGRQQERRAGRGALRRQEDRRLHHPDLPLRAGGGARAGRHPGQALRGDRRRGPQLADRRGRRQAQGGAHPPRNWRIWTTAARSAPRTCWPPRWPPGPRTSGITYVAFTATPKAKTLELFGTRPDPTEPAGARTTCPTPFHVYSMRQAIEEGFILDVLQNYTTYKLAFKLAHEGKELRRRGGRAQRGPEGDHGLGAAAPLQHRPEGADRGRALPRVRRPAARRQGQGDGGGRQPQGGGALASWPSTSTSRTQGYPIGTLVAFSGEVNDPESGPDAVHRDQHRR